MRLFLRVVALLTMLFVASILGGCGRLGSTTPAKPVKCFIIPASAYHVSSYLFHGQHQTNYTVKEKYPAPGLLKYISTELSKQGWKPLKESWLNPGISTSHVQGWTEDIRWSKKGEQRRIYTWMAQWQNSKGDIVNYQLVCGGPVSIKIPDVITVYSQYMPAKEVSRHKAHVSKMKRQEEQRRSP